MKHFGTKYRAVYSDTVYSHEPPPANLMEGGFFPSTPSHIGSPIVAQWFNWLFGSLTALSPFTVTRTGSNNWTFKNPFSATVDGLLPVVKAVRLSGVNGSSLTNASCVMSSGVVGGITSDGASNVSVSGDTMTVLGTSMPSNITTIIVEPIGEKP